MTARKSHTNADFQQVVATRSGFHDGHLKDRGDRFAVPAGLKSKWFIPVGSDKDVEEALSANSRILDGEPKAVIPQLAALDSQTLNNLISEEQSGKARKTIIRAAEDILANRVGMIGGPDPAAKDPNEKDPITITGEKVGSEDADKDDDLTK